ncbi:MAG: hypothetical protein Ct9H300mP4_05630 [Gammaproteobacteria bacterium]|nr:MAG: hypothetical protein Ct9H300mP4_05630 [Gammaproteobacteria bacterium]
MSIGFHYLETLRSSLSLQWLSKDEAPGVLGKLLSVHSASPFGGFLSILYIVVFMFEPNYPWLYAVAGFFTVIVGIFCHFTFPQFSEKVEQRKDLVFRKRYWLYYALTFLSGARRQIFMVFAAFLLVQKFGFPLDKMVLLLLVNSGITAWVAPKMGILIEKIGERKALTLEYIALIIIFLSYAVVDNVNIAFFSTFWIIFFTQSPLLSKPTFRR